MPLKDLGRALPTGLSAAESANLTAGDARDTTLMTKNARRGGDKDDRRMCGQVAKVVAMVLAGECDDPVLQDLEVVEVRPLNDAGRLCITVRSTDPGQDLEVIQDRLEKRRAYIRVEVARTLNRKQAPQVEFLLVKAETPGLT